MKPLSAGYYIKNNKGRALIIIFMMFFTSLLYIGGNYVDSMWWYWNKVGEYGNRMTVAHMIATDEDGKDFKTYVEKLKEDEDLTVMGRHGYGNTGREWTCTLGFTMGAPSYVFNTVEDLKTAFGILGIQCDYSNLKDTSMVMSRMYADNLGMKPGDRTKDGTYSLDALIDDDSFITFYIDEVPEEKFSRVNVLSKTLSGDAFYNRLRELKGDLKVDISANTVDGVNEQMYPIKLIFYAALLILSIIMAVTLNSVVTGQYVKRIYEFGVYRALGLSKGCIKRKIAGELLLMDLIALTAGMVLMLVTTFLLNELVYLPGGMYLPYFSEIGLVGLLLSNVVMVVPMILIKGARMCKADVTEF